METLILKVSLYSKKRYFYGVLAFFFLRYLVPIFLIPYGSVLQAMYTGLLSLIMVLILLDRFSLEPSKVIYEKVPASFKYSMAFIIIVVFIASAHRIGDLKSFLSPSITGEKHVIRQHYFFFINGVLLSILFFWLVDSIKKVEMFIYLIIVIGLILSIEGYLQYFDIVYVYDPNEGKPSGIENRLTAMTGYSAGVTGEQLVAPLCFAIGLLNITHGKKIWFLMLSSGVLLIALILTYGRGPYISVGMSFLIFSFFGFKRIVLKRRYNLILLALLLLLCVIIAITFIGVVEHWNTTGRLKKGGNNLATRVLRWILVLPAIKEKPLLGYGLGSSKEVLGMHVGSTYKGYYSSIHNLYLAWVVDTGFIGLLALFIICLITVWNFYVARKNSIILNNQKLFFYSTLLMSTFLGSLAMYMFDSSYYALDICFFMFFSLSFVLKRLSKISIINPHRSSATPP